MKVAIEINTSDSDYVLSQLPNSEGVNVVESRQFQADTQTTQIIIDLAVLSIPIVGNIIVNLIKSKKQCSVKIDGKRREITADNVEDVIKVLEATTKI